jgi:signal transduction histidine kinase
MVWTWLSRHPRTVDWALVLFAFATTVGTDLGKHRAHPLGLLLLSPIICLPLLVRRTHPLLALGATTAATAVAAAGWGIYIPFPVGLALFTVADRCERRVSLTAGASALVVLSLPLLSSVGWTNGLGFVGRLLGFVVAWLLGDSFRARRMEMKELEDKAERLERERRLEAERAAAEEQARIARELHDLIAHNISVMVLQASAAYDVFENRPDRAREAIRRVVDTGRKALTELRQLLGAVRTDGTDYAPLPGLARLDDLVGQVRNSGLEVAVTVDGTPRPLPRALDLSAYRIVQEALTNTLKHADARHADVAIRYRDDRIDVEILDDGTGDSNGGGGGQGLIGMRERVGAFGGSLSAGPASGGGFLVSAMFPLGPAT